VIASSALESSPASELVDLQGLSAGVLDAILEEQAQTCRKVLECDFSRQSARIRFCLEAGLLRGYALITGRRAVGYAHTLSSAYEGRIENLYVAREFRSAAAERRLLGAALASLQPVARRIAWHPALPPEIPVAALPLAASVRVYPRYIMLADAANAAASLPERSGGCAIEPWSEAYEEPAARLVVSAYEGHIDRELNDQYGSADGARQAIRRIVLLEDGGPFLQPASFVGIERRTGAVCGLVLLRRVLSDAARGELLCVAPTMRRTGLAYELVRRSLCALAPLGMRSVSLNVAATNQAAIRLYGGVGFQVRCATFVCVWEGFRGG
jgi:ribosomal protein S18 acetylase RimI-like enzyme